VGKHTKEKESSVVSRKFPKFPPTLFSSLGKGRERERGSERGSEIERERGRGNERE